jgi:hypothetical protein
MNTFSLLDRALRAYHRTEGAHAISPNKALCTVSTRGVVTLANTNGTLARYRLVGKTLRRQS